MKKLMLAAVIWAGVATVARAQETPVADVTAGYSALYVVKGFTYFMNGGSASAAFNVNNWLGAVGDFGAYHAPSGLNNFTAETYTFGPRFSYRHWERLTPFGQVLVGGVHASQKNTQFTGVSNAFAFGAGVGADLGLDRGGRYAVRPQVEYFGFHASGNTLTSVRFSVGFVVRVGKRG
jgi:outer membrane immunogenic protein